MQRANWLCVKMFGGRKSCCLLATLASATVLLDGSCMVEAKLRAGSHSHASPHAVMAGLSLKVSGHTAAEKSDEEEHSSQTDSALVQSAEELLRQGFQAIAKLMALPTHATEEQQEDLLKVLEDESSKAEDRLTGIKGAGSYNSTANLQHISDPKVRARMEEMHKFLEESQRQSRLIATGYLSKLKNAMRLVKKGALQGDEKAHKSLETVLEKMGVTPREYAHPEEENATQTARIAFAQKK